MDTSAGNLEPINALDVHTNFEVLECIRLSAKSIVDITVVF